MILYRHTVGENVRLILSVCYSFFYERCVSLKIKYCTTGTVATNSKIYTFTFRKSKLDNLFLWMFQSLNMGVSLLKKIFLNRYVLLAVKMDPELLRTGKFQITKEGHGSCLTLATH